jgi:alpha-tubulin suppressor-like RCC1 family protein
LWCWGLNADGQLGLGTTTNVPANYAPQQVGSLINWATVSAGGYHTLGTLAG